MPNKKEPSPEPAGGMKHALDSLREKLPEDIDFRTWWFTVPHHRRERIERWTDSARILQHHATNLELIRGQHELWAGLRKNSGHTMTALANHIGVDPGNYSKWENGHTYPSQRTRDRLRPVLRNLAADLYYRSITRLSWELYWTDKKKNAPENITTADPEFLAWIERNGEKHPLLEELQPTVEYDDGIVWPINK
jgi:transcriptional regulator with XRE-family HTH domain